LHKTVSSYSMLSIKKKHYQPEQLYHCIYIMFFSSHLFPAAGVPVNLFHTVAFLPQPKHVYSEVKTTCVAHILSDLCGNAHRSRILAEESMAEQQTAADSRGEQTFGLCFQPRTSLLPFSSFFHFDRKTKSKNTSLFLKNKTKIPPDIMFGIHTHWKVTWIGHWLKRFW